jgi:hypothetical protein
VCSDIRVRPHTRTTPEVCPSLSGVGAVTAQATKSRSGAADDPTGLIADPGLRTSVYSDVCSDIRVRPHTRTTPEVCPSLSGVGAVTAQATKSRSGAADDPTGLIADPGLRSRAYPDVCSGIRVRPHTRTTPEICPKLRGASGVAAQAAVSRRCAGGGTGLIASARSSSRHLRQTQWYCREANRNQSKFNQCNLSHVIFPPSHVVLGLSDVSFVA